MGNGKDSKSKMINIVSFICFAFFPLFSGVGGYMLYETARRSGAEIASANVIACAILVCFGLVFILIGIVFHKASTFDDVAERLRSRVLGKFVERVVNPEPKNMLYNIAGGDDPNRIADIIFIHGVGGDPYKTWMRDADSKASFWPTWLAEDFQNIGVWTLGYAANVSKWKSETMPVPDRGKTLLERLYGASIGERPVIFVAHSLGGIIAKQMLRLADEKIAPRWQKISKNFRGVAFVATPHAGAGIANLAKIVSLILRTNEHVSDLEKHSANLRELHDWFLAFWKEKQFVCRSYAERKALRPGAFGLKLPAGLLVVDQTSAETNIPGEPTLPLDEDHFSICKPASRRDDLCVSIWPFIRECIQEQEPTKR